MSSIFAQEVSERAIVARGAKHRVRGSKSRKCHMSTDGMTQRQWEKRNGAVNTYRLHQPMSWEEFKAYPVDLQREYLNRLISLYNANATSLGEMFGIGASAVRGLIEKNELGIKFHVGHGMTRAQKAAWHDFIAGNNSESTEHNTELACQSEDVPINAEECVQDQQMSMTQFSFTFQGKIDTAAIANSIRQLLGDRGYGKIEVVCTL